MSVDHTDRGRFFGTFKTASGAEAPGEIYFSGRESLLVLRHPTAFPSVPIPFESDCVTGTLQDQTKITAVKCVTLRQGYCVAAPGETLTFLELFPHFILRGDHSLFPTEANVSALNFTIHDATTLFYDFDAFGSVIDAKPFIENGISSYRPFHAICIRYVCKNLAAVKPN